MTESRPVLLASTALGDVVVSSGVVYLLTTCCKASGKGGEHGVVCRACYRDVDDVYGWGALATDPCGVSELASVLASVVGRFAPKVAASVFAAAQNDEGSTSS